MPVETHEQCTYGSAGLSLPLKTISQGLPREHDVPFHSVESHSRGNANHLMFVLLYDLQPQTLCLQITSTFPLLTLNVPRFFNVRLTPSTRLTGESRAAFVMQNAYPDQAGEKRNGSTRRLDSAGVSPVVKLVERRG